MQATTSPESDCPTRLWTRSEYYAMSEMGFFEGERVELLDGEIVMTASQLYSHTSSITKVARVVGRAFGNGYWTRDQMPLQVNDRSEPEPDISVVIGTEDDYQDHPTTAALVVEVSGSTLKRDRTRKAAIYALAGILDYWIVNLWGRCVEVHRQPRMETSGKFGYEKVEVFDETCFISPLANPRGKNRRGGVVTAQRSEGCRLN